MSKRLSIHSGDSDGYSPPSYYKEPALATIDVKSEDSLNKWGSILELSRPELLDAIHDFGPVVRDIRRGLLLRNQSEEEAA